MANSSSSDISDSEMETTDKQLAFVLKMKEYNILFNKSQAPRVKAEKEAALKELAKLYHYIYNIELTTKQVSKKISNMKNEIKKKIHNDKIGKKVVVYKPWEMLFLEIMEAQKNPVVSKKSDPLSSVGVEDDGASSGSSSSIRDCVIPVLSPIPRKKIKSTSLPETNETKDLSNSELQRLVLLEQLKLIRMQQEIIRLDTKYL